MVAISLDHPNLYIFDLFASICPDGQEYCNIMSTNGLPLYKDADHFTDLGSRIALDQLVKWAKNQNLLNL